MELSMLFGIVLGLTFFGAVTLFIVGLIVRIVKYANTPSPLKIPTTPAPKTKAGVAVRMFLDIVLFNSLFKGNKWTWIGGLIFHYTFLTVVLMHMRFFFYPEPTWVMQIQAVGVYAGIVLPIAVLYLLFRRTSVDRTVYISSMADYFILALILTIAGTGLLMRYYVRPFMVDIKAFAFSLVNFDFLTSLLTFNMDRISVPLEPVFIVHFLCVCVLLAYFPFSKLLHMGGIFFSPTRFMVDNPRRERHVNPWSPNLKPKE
jgi:nitrate reductase gamma subunit